MGNIKFASLLIIACISVFAFIYVTKCREIRVTRRQAALVGVAWVAIVLFEYYFLGRDSFIYWDDEGEYFVPIANYLNQFHLGGQYMHGLAGGIDRFAGAASGGQIVDLYLLLDALFPTWMAIVLNKTLAMALGFSGAYLLSRRAFGAERFAALGLAALFTMTDAQFIDRTTWTGAGFAVFPMVLYLSAFPIDGRRLALRMAALGAIAASMPPTHALPTLCVTVLTGAVLIGRGSLRTIVLPIAVMVACSLLNWHEPIWALKQLAPFATRTSSAVAPLPAFWEFTISTFMVVFREGIGSVFIMAGMAVLVWLRRSEGIRAFCALLLCGAIVIAATFFPWHWFSLEAVRRITLSQIFFVHGLVLLMAASRAVTALEGVEAVRHRAWLRRVPVALLVATALGAMAEKKTTHFREFLQQGGQAQFQGFENLRSHDWLAPSLTRVATLRLRQPEPNIPSGFYGLDAIDGSMNVVPMMFSTFLARGINVQKAAAPGFSYLGFDYEYFWCCGQQYAIERQFDLDMLRIANVGFVISPVPIQGSVQKVSGPAQDQDQILRTFADKVGYLKDRVARIFDPGLVYVYALKPPLPRVYAASQVQFVPADLDTDSFLDVVRVNALQRRIVVPEGVARPDIVARPSLVVRSVTAVLDGYEALIEAPEGGIVVANVSPLPFWSAEVDGVTRAVFPANMIHSAVEVPPGARRIVFRYHRTTLAEALLGGSRR
ncbi:hypothetical protein H261_20954 [Paramagnetospirillum caucaseum]|uniref:YfhO family protein n=1 Tax=Paramagnetospirillum caucaseum TaxID=1244869 RepID=M2ZKX0_9PROT|nr:hypothetical protein [Paramagnetospirillum caucaseum]EME67947.1 hypothetical protein H261_20954 [Paramagnetospirillum caucaseum]